MDFGDTRGPVTPTAHIPTDLLTPLAACTASPAVIGLIRCNRRTHSGSDTTAATTGNRYSRPSAPPAHPPSSVPTYVPTTEMTSTSLR